MREVDDADSALVKEEVLLLDVGVVDAILSERGQEHWVGTAVLRAAE